MGYMRKRVVALLLSAVMCIGLAGCSKKPENNNPTKVEFEALRQATMIGEYNIQEVKEEFHRFVTLLYNPPNQGALNNSFQIIEPYCTTILVDAMVRDTNEYSPNLKKVVAINSLQFSRVKDDFESRGRLLVEVDLRVEKQPNRMIYLEFWLNEEDVFYDYDVWVYEV